MNFITFKDQSIATTTKYPSPNNPASTRVDVEYKLYFGGKVYKCLNLKTINKWGKVCSNRRWFSVDGKGMCKRDFYNQISFL